MSLFLRLFGRASSSDMFEPRSFSFDGLGAKKTSSGEMVSPQTAMTLAAYYAAIRAISEDTAKLPASAVENLVPRGRRPLGDHPVTRLWDASFSDAVGAFAGRETLVQWALGWGNGCAEIQRDQRGRAVALHPIHPSRITFRIVDGALVYDVRSADLGVGADVVRMSSSEVFHLRGMGDHFVGWSIARLAAESIGVGMAARSFGSSFFGNDTAIGTVITFPNRIDPADRTSFRTSLIEAHAGARAAGTPLVLDNGADIKRLGIAPEDAQLLGSQEFSVEEIARWFRVPPHKLGHLKRAAGWSTLESSNADYVIDCLMPWVVRIEKEAKRKLLTEPADARVVLKHYFNGLLRGDFVTRTQGYSQMVAMGAMTPNEVRELEDMNPADSENADRLIVQGAMVLLDSLEEDPPAPTPRPMGLPPAPEDDGPEDDEPEEDAGPAAATPDALHATLAAALSRVAAKEAKAYERAAAKYAGDLPAFQKWARAFYESWRSDWVGAIEPAGGAVKAKQYADEGVAFRAKRALACFADGKTQVDPIECDRIAASILKERA